MGRKKQYKLPIVLTAIKGCNGIVSSVAKTLQCDWHTADIYIHKWEETRQAFDDECERVLDFAESKIMESIKQGNTADAKWYLSKKGKARGFGDDTYIPPSTADNELVITIDNAD